MRVAYVPVSQREWQIHFQRGGGFRGNPYQRGGGLGSIFRSIFRAILPIAKTAGKAVGRRMLKSGADVATDLLEGHNFKETIKHRGKQTAGDLLQSAADKMKGAGLSIKGRRKRKTAIRKKQLGGRRKRKAPKRKPAKRTKKRKTRQVRNQLGTLYV